MYDMIEKKKNILIIDDLTDNVKLLAATLEEFGYNVSMAKNYDDLCLRMKSKSSELIFIGAKMSGSDIFQAIREIIKKINPKNIPILMYSSKENASEKISAFNSGAVDYFSLPLVKEDLLKRVKKHLIKEEIGNKHLWTKKIIEIVNEKSRAGGWEYNVETNDLYWSIITKKIHEVALNYKPKLENSIVYYREGKSREVVIRCFEKAIESGSNWDVEVELVTSRGNLIWVRLIGEPIFKNGKVVRIFGTFQEISDEKKYKIELEKSKTTNREVQKVAKTGSWEIDISTGEMQWSDELFYLLEIDKTTKASRSLFLSKVHPDDLELLNNFATKNYNDSSNSDNSFRISTTKGKNKFVKIDSHGVYNHNNKLVNVVGTIIDISDQKWVNDELKGLQKHFQMSFETASIAICRLGHDGRINLINERAIELFGYTREELIGKSFVDLTYSDDLELSIQFFNNVIKGISNQSKFSKRCIHKDGTVIWTQISSAFVQAEAIEDSHFFAYIMDVTDLKKAEISLNQYKNIISRSQDMLALIDRNYKYLIANDAYLKLVDRTREEVIGYSVEEVNGEAFFAKNLKERVERCLTGEQVNSAHWQIIEGGEFRYIEIKYTPFRNSENEIEGYVVDGRDITEKKRSQERLQSLTRIQQAIIEDSTIKQSSIKILEELLKISRSEFGYIAEVSYENDLPVLKNHAEMNLTWEEGTPKYREIVAQEDMKAFNEESFFDKIITTGKSIIINNQTIITKGKTNEMMNFIGLPFYHNNILIGIVGMENGSVGYQKRDIELLEPFLATCSTLINTFKNLKIRNEAEKERKKLADIVSYSNDAIISTDLLLNVVSWNSGAEKLLGYSSEEMLGESAIRLCPIYLEEKHDVLIRSIQMGNLVQSYETTQIKKDGTQIQVNMSLFPLISDTGEVCGVSSILRDITEQKEAVEMKAKFTRNLEIKVSDRTAELQRAKNDLAISLEKEKELGELKSRFVATASHQFRTPLTVIQSNMGILAMQQDVMDDVLKVSFEKAYDRIKKQIGRMTSLMDDVLILGKMNSGGITARTQLIDLIELCTEVSNNYNQIQEDGRSIKFEQTGTPTLVALDSKQMEHVISNLLSNALKYSPQEKSPILSLIYSKSKVVISVKDEGMGIPEKDLKNLFEPFYRASNVGEITGTGLGSTIAKEYVELNGGKISVKSTINIGSEFIIEFNNK